MAPKTRPRECRCSLDDKQPREASPGLLLPLPTFFGLRGMATFLSSILLMIIAENRSIARSFTTESCSDHASLLLFPQTLAISNIIKHDKPPVLRCRSFRECEIRSAFPCSTLTSTTPASLPSRDDPLSQGAVVHAMLLNQLPLNRHFPFPASSNTCLPAVPLLHPLTG